MSLHVLHISYVCFLTLADALFMCAWDWYNVH